MAEHRLARLVQLGLRQTRYRGSARIEAQLLLTATVANLTRIWAQRPSGRGAVGLAHSPAPGNHPLAAAPGPDPQLRSRSVAGDTVHRAAPDAMAS